jgi:hypothetical protein
VTASSPRPRPDPPPRGSRPHEVFVGVGETKKKRSLLWRGGASGRGARGRRGGGPNAARSGSVRAAVSLWLGAASVNPAPLTCSAASASEKRLDLYGVL